jgi:hypothetical protein
MDTNTLNPLNARRSQIRRSRNPCAERPRTRPQALTTLQTAFFTNAGHPPPKPPQAFQRVPLAGILPCTLQRNYTVVLRKQGKDDYTQPKSYRPIALLNTLGKALETVVANRLTYLADTYHLLPSRHTGDRKLALTDHAMPASITSRDACLGRTEPSPHPENQIEAALKDRVSEDKVWDR